MTAALEGGWVVSSTPGPHFTPGEDSVPIVQEAGWAPGPVCTDGSAAIYATKIQDPTQNRQNFVHNETDFVEE